MGEGDLALPMFDELYERIRALPEGVTGEILQPGVLRTMRRPGLAHRHAAKLVFHALVSFDRHLRGGAWWLEVETEIRFPRDLLAVPDIAGFRVERVADVPDENPLTVLPDWCCEILSPTTARDDRRLKLPLYARSGVPWIWLVDPEQRLVEVYETVQGRPTLAATAAGDERVVLPPFEGELNVAPWWMPEKAPEK